MARRSTIAQMREQIQIVSASDSPFGEFSLERGFSTVYTLRAKKDDLNGTAVRNGIGQDETVSHMFTIRRGPSITTDYYVVWDGKYFQIKTTRPVGTTTGDPRQQFLQIYCKLDEEQNSFKEPSPEDA